MYAHVYFRICVCAPGGHSRPSRAKYSGRNASLEAVRGMTIVGMVSVISRMASRSHVHLHVRAPVRGRRDETHFARYTVSH
jgi:hypothetical protein